nr:Ger(x)C family spore germination protein [Paenibacillus hamazuiensis]
MLLCSFLAGCWNSVELNELGIVSATAIDYKKGMYNVSYQIVVPQAVSSATGQASPSMAPIAVFSTQGATLKEAAEKANLEFPRTLFFAHNRVIVIGENAAKQGISGLLDLYFRNQESRETVSLYVTQDDPKQILKTLMPIEKIQGAGIFKMTNVAEKQSSTVKRTRIYEIAYKITSRSSSAVVPEISFSGRGQPKQSVDAMNEVSHDVILKFQRNGVFRKDRLAGWLSEDESLGLRLATGEANGGMITVGCPKEESKGKISFQLNKVKAKLETMAEDGRANIAAKVTAYGVLAESSCKTDFSKPESLEPVKQALKEHLSGLIRAAWKASLDLRSDIFGISDEVYRHQPELWKMWADKEDPWKEAQLTPQVEVKVERTGMSNDSFKKLLDK